MIVYKDICTGEEVATDAYLRGCEDEDFLLKFKGKMCQVSVGGDIDPSLIGGNASAEDQVEESCDQSQSKMGIDIVMAQSLEDRGDYFTSKKVLQGYLKKWAKNVADALKDVDKEKCERFKKGCGAKLKAFMDRWTPDVTVYTGSKFDPLEAKCGVFIADWDDDGMGITMYGIQDGFEAEKY